MAVIAKDKGGEDFKPIPQGVHMARCYRVIYIGTQDRTYMGQPKGSAEKVMLAWELYGEDDTGAPLVRDDGKPLAIAKWYTLSLSKKANMRAELESWRGKAFTDEELSGFDLKKLLSSSAMVNVKHNKGNDGKTYSNVASLSPLPKAMKDSLPAAIERPQFFDATEPDMKVFETLSENLKEKIQNSHEWRKKATANQVAQTSAKAPVVPDNDDDLPW